MLRSSSIANDAASNPAFGRPFPEQFEPDGAVLSVVEPSFVVASHGAGGGGGGGVALVGVVFMSPAHTGRLMAIASRIEASDFRQVFIDGLLKRMMFFVSQVQSDWVVLLEVPGDGMILARLVT